MSFVTGPLSMRLKLAHGFGAVAFGVKDNGFSFFLLIYYNQVLGMNAGVVSLALGAALLVDAVIDPILGYLSDRTYTRWGRRLPWLYAAALPLAVVWVILWNPPAGETPTFWSLLAIAVVVRIFLSACEVPSVAMVPEITADYDERTTLFRYRYLFGWMAGLAMMLLAYTVFMPGAEGMLEPGGYSMFGTFGAILIFISVVGSALGQHRVVAHLPVQRPAPFSLRNAFSEIKEAFAEPAFVIFAFGGLAAYVSQGMTFSISNYLNLFVWQFGQVALIAYPIVLFASVVLMFFIVGPMHQRLGKAYTAALSIILALIFGLIPYGLLLLGFWPEPGTLASTVLLYSFILFGNCFGIVSLISGSSMIAEIVEAFEMRTGRRAEGSFYAGNWFIQKCATGVGIFLTGQIIAFSQLPDDAVQGAVEWPIIASMVLVYGGISIVLALIAAFWFRRFPIDRAGHEERVKALNAAARADMEGGITGA